MGRSEGIKNGERLDLLPQTDRNESVEEQAVRLLHDFAGKKLAEMEFLGIDSSDSQAMRYLRAVVMANMVLPRPEVPERVEAAGQMWEEFMRDYFGYLQRHPDVAGEEEWFERVFWDDIVKQVKMEVDEAFRGVGDEVRGLPVEIQRANNEILSRVFVVK